jgi:hypothetical protein
MLARRFLDVKRPLIACSWLREGATMASRRRQETLLGRRRRWRAAPSLGQTYYFRSCTLVRKAEVKSDPSQVISFLVK